MITSCLNHLVDFPDFACIREVLVTEDQTVLLGLHKLVVEEFSEHHRAYVVKESDEKCIKPLPSLQVLQLIPVPLTTASLKFVVLKYVV